MRFIKCMERDLVFTFRLISLKARVFSTSIPHPESPVSTKRDPGNESDSFSPSRQDFLSGDSTDKSFALRTN